MPTFVYSKEDFITFIENQVSDSQVIIFTNELCGNLTISKKSGIKVNHQYAEAVFKDEGVGHIAFGESHPIGIIISEKKRLSKTSLSILEKSKSQ